MNRNNKGMILNFEGGANRFEVWRLEDEPVKKSKHFWVPSMLELNPLTKMMVFPGGSCPWTFGTRAISIP